MSEKKVSEDNKIELEQNISEQSSEELGMVDVKDKDTFFSLCPSILENNEEYKSYYEALDYAFQNNDIKNIAITGIYGAGKSTVWQSYVKKRNLKNIVTITLGQYDKADNATSNCWLEGKIKEENDKKNCISEFEQENRIERKLINQLISQIRVKDAPLSKYKIKSNKTMKDIIWESTCLIFCFLSILFWMEKEWFLQCLMEAYGKEYKIQFCLLCLVLFIFPVFFYLLRFIKSQRISIQKIQLKGLETNINDGNIEDETVLDKDIKEIIYLLTSAKVETLVIEDLDRFDNISIFIKLRELNYMLNQYLKINAIDRVIKFVYMVRDGLLGSKDRVKFFDFVLPVLPYIHSRSSENILLSGMEDCGFKDSKHLIIKTSFYIGDMRVLKNIVNEYRIYSHILAMKRLQLSQEKLFVLIVVKNLFPYEFDLIQIDEGDIFYAFNKGKESLIKSLKSKLLDKNKGFNSELEKELNYISTASLKALISKWKEINDNIVKDNSIFGDGAQIVNNSSISLLKFFITEGYLSEDYWLYLSPFHEGDLSYNDVIFMKRLIEGQDNIDTEIDNIEAVLSRLDEDDFMRKGILNKKLLTAILKQQDDGFNLENKFPIKTIMKSIGENGSYLDLILILVNSEYDFVCRYVHSALHNSYYTHIENLLKEVQELEESGTDSYNEYDDILGFILAEDWIELHNWVACSVLTYDDIDAVKNFFDVVERKNLIQYSLPTVLKVRENKLEIFFENLDYSNIQFISLEFLQKNNFNYDNTVSKDYNAFIRNIAERIQRSKTYTLNVKNIQVLVNIILEKEVEYGELLSEIYNNHALKFAKEYIREDYNNFITEYINSSTSAKFKNSEEMVIEILNSDISEEDKIKYIENNEVQIQDIKNLTIPLNGNIAKKLYLKNTISCSKENVNKCYAAIELSDVPEFVTYLNGEINTQNEEEILKDNSKLCEDLLKSEKTSEELFGFTIKYAKNPLDILTSNISEDKCFLLIESNLIKISKSNVRILVDSCFTESIDKWLELAKGDDQDNLVEFLCTENLDKIKDYIEMFLRHLQEKNAIKLIDKMNGEMKIQRIYLKRKRYPICARLSKYLLDTYPIIIENIRYICKEFKDFEYQREFVEALIRNNQFQDLKDEDLNKDVMNYLLTYSLVSIENKVMLLQTKIQNKVKVSELKEYIDSVDEIKDLNEVWNHKQPKLNSTYKQDIGKALADCGYVKIRNTFPISRIVLVDSQRLSNNRR